MVQCQLYQYGWFGELRRFFLKVLVCHTPPFARHSREVEAPPLDTIVSKWDHKSPVYDPVMLSSKPSRINYNASPERNIERLWPSSIALLATRKVSTAGV